MKNKIILYDIENFPHVGEFWDGMYEQNILSVLEYGGIASIAWKELGKKKVHAIALPMYHGKDKDVQLLKVFHKVLEEADIIVAHNGNSFDIKKLNAYFIRAGLSPLPARKSIDTLRVAKTYFRFNSNKLDELGHYLGLGRKVQTGGYSLWQGCKRNDPRAWRQMIKYNKMDVILLEKVYYKFLPWITNHPFVNNNKGKCPNCGTEHLQKRGFSMIGKKLVQRYQCLNEGCGAWTTDNKLIK